jgi:hypothetical protein
VRLRSSTAQTPAAKANPKSWPTAGADGPSKPAHCRSACQLREGPHGTYIFAYAKIKVGKPLAEDHPTLAGRCHAACALQGDGRGQTRHATGSRCPAVRPEPQQRRSVVCGMRGVPSRLPRCWVLPWRLRLCDQPNRGATRRPSDHHRPGCQRERGMVPNSTPRRTDTEGKPLPFCETAYTLGTAQVLLMSDYSPRSFDGRYFGPIEKTGIKGVLRPVLTLGLPAKSPG